MSTGYRIPKLSPDSTAIQETLCRLSRRYYVCLGTHIYKQQKLKKKATNLKKSKGRYMEGFRGKEGKE